MIRGTIGAERRRRQGPPAATRSGYARALTPTPHFGTSRTQRRSRKRSQAPLDRPRSFRDDLRDLMLLVAVDHPKVGGVGQIMPALAVTLREPILLIVGPVDPGEVRPPRRSWLLALRPLRPTTALLRRRGILPGSSSLDGGMEELLELRASKCSSLASFAANCPLASTRSATCVDSVVICPS